MNIKSVYPVINLILTSLAFNESIFLLFFTDNAGFLPANCFADAPTNTSPSLKPT